MSTSRKISAKNLFRKKSNLNVADGTNLNMKCKSTSEPNLLSNSDDFKYIKDIKDALPPMEPHKGKKKFSVKPSLKRLKLKTKEKQENKGSNLKPGSKDTGDPVVGSRLADNVSNQNEYTFHSGSKLPENTQQSVNSGGVKEDVGYIGQRGSDLSKTSSDGSDSYRHTDYCNTNELPAANNSELPEYACADEVRDSLGLAAPASTDSEYRSSTSTCSSRDSHDSLTPRSLVFNSSVAQASAAPPLPPKPEALRGKQLIDTNNEDEKRDSVSELPPRPPARQLVLKSGRANLPQLQGLKAGLRRRTTYESVDLSYGLPGELRKLPHQPWYWGPLNQEAAEAKLRGLPDGYFLVRDSSDERYLLSLSFNSSGRPVHTRFEYVNGLFSINDSEGYTSVVDLINEAVRESHNGVFSYMQSSHGDQTFPARLTHWVSRFSEVKSLQHLSRFVIRETFPRHYLQSLPIPPKLLSYVLENQYT